MFSLGSSHRFYLYDGHCDMRKSFDGLCGLVITVMGRQPTSGEVFVFLDRNRTHIKLLHWEHGGFVLYYKRLEQGTFGASELKKDEFSWSALVLMVDGIIQGSFKNKFTCLFKFEIEIRIMVLLSMVIKLENKLGL